MDASEHLKMSQVEAQLWWYRVLHNKVIKSLKLISLNKSDPILDAGCGTGGLLSILLAAGYSNLSGFDISPTAAQICSSRGFAIKTLAIQDIGTNYDNNSFAAIISNDVLCYLSDQQIAETIKATNPLLQPGGYLIINLPAYQAFSGIHDICVGLKTRTTAQKIYTQLANAGYEIEQLHHWPFLLSPLVLVTRLKQRMRIKSNPDCDIESDVNLPPRLLNSILFTLTSAEKFLGNARVWGSSIFIVARKS